MLGILVWMAVVISLAMGVTWLVVKVSPSGRPKSPADGDKST